VNAHVPAKWILLTVLAMGWACGPKNGAMAPASPWKESLAEYFDDSVDFTLNPQSLSGQWLFKYQEQLKGRMHYSEYVLGVNIVSVTNKTASGGEECKDLYCEVKARVKGNYQSGSLTLRVCDDSPGFDSFKAEDGRLYERVFVAFLKLYEKEDEGIGIHWHLSPLSKGLKEGMDGILQKDKQKDKSKKYIYEND
jgi:hypothetical protein